MKKSKKSLEKQKAEISEQYITITDHEKIVNERGTLLQKQQELAIVELTSKYDKEMDSIRQWLEKEIAESNDVNTQKMAEYKLKALESAKQLKTLGTERKELITKLEKNEAMTQNLWE